MLVWRSLLLASLAVVCTSCSQDSSRPQTPRTWWAYVDNGDKPGNGWLLTEKDGEIVACDFYLLPPEQSAAAKGCQFPATITERTGVRRVRLSLDIGGQTDVLDLTVKDTFAGETCEGKIVRHAKPGDATPIELTFRLQRE